MFRLTDFYNYIRQNKIFVFFLVAFHLLYFWFAWHYKGICTKDSDEYLQTAENLRYYFESYNWVLFKEKDPFYYSLRPPLYGMFILLCKLLVNSDYFVLLVQNLFSILVWALTIRIAGLLIKGIKVEVPVLISLLLTPTHMIMTNSVMADLHLQFFQVLCLYFFTRYEQKKDTFSIWGANICLTLSVFTKPILMYFWIPNLCLAVYLFYRNRNWNVLVSSLLMPMCILLWCVRNEQKTGYFHFSSIKTQNILDLNAGAVLEEKYGMNASDSIKTSILTKASYIKDYAARSRFIEDTSVAIIKKDLPLYIYCHARGMVSFMMSVGRADTKTFFSDHPDEENISLLREMESRGFWKGFVFYISNVNLLFSVYLILAVVWNLVLVASLLTFIFDRHFPPVIKIFLLATVFYSIFVCGPGGYVRFKVAVLPYLILTLPFFFSMFRRFLPGYNQNKG